jgi:hypothetical protein
MYSLVVRSGTPCASGEDGMVILPLETRTRH